MSNPVSSAPRSAVPPTNGLGVAGFVCSLVGLLTGGILSPVGLILSLVAIGREPRGLATAGVVLGLLGTCGGVLLVLFGVGAVLAAVGLAVAAIALSESEQGELTLDMVRIAVAAKAFERAHGTFPVVLDEMDLAEATRVDPWGRTYTFTLVEAEPGFDIVSAGADGVPATADDVALSRLGEAWSAGGLDVDVHADEERGAVTIRLGDLGVEAEGAQERGSVIIDLGDHIIEVIEDDAAGADRTEKPDR